MQVKITRIFRGDKDTKYGMRNSVGLKTVEHGDKWVSGLFDPTKGKNGTEDWKEGDTVEIFAVEKGGYTNFTLQPKAVAVDGNFVNEVQARLIALENKVFGSIDTEDIEPDF